VGVVAKGPGAVEDEGGAATKLAERQRRRRMRRSSKPRSASSNWNEKGKALAVAALVQVKMPSWSWRPSACEKMSAKSKVLAVEGPALEKAAGPWTLRRCGRRKRRYDLALLSLVRTTLRT